MCDGKKIRNRYSRNHKKEFPEEIFKSRLENRLVSLFCDPPGVGQVFEISLTRSKNEPIFDLTACFGQNNAILITGEAQENNY